jgi:hypothetical protein
MILGADGKEYGPVTADKMREWIAGGRANGQTKARREGETEWRNLADFPEFALSAGAAVPPPLAAMPAPVAAAPSVPVVPVPLSGDASAIAADLIARSAKIDVFDCLAKSFDLLKNNFWPLVGVTLLVVFVQTVIGMIPIIGMISGFFINGVFYGGLYYYYLGKVRGEPREVGDAFAGFSQAFVPLMLGTLMVTGLTLLVMVPFAATCIPFFVSIATHSHGALPVFTPLMFAGLFIGGLVALYLSISWAFTFILIIDRGLSPWTAMEVSRRVISRQWFRVFFVLLLGGILTMLGLIGLIIGIIFTMPLVFGAIIYAYEGACNPPASATGG